MVTGFMNYGQQTIRAARYIGQGFMITLSHTNRLPVTIQYPYEKLITSERFRGRIHFEFDKCIACEVCVRVCPIDRSVPRSTLKKKYLYSPQPFRVKKMRKCLSLSKNGAFRGVKWDRRDFIIGVLNKTTFSFFSFFFHIEKVIRMRGVKLFIILASSYFSAGPPLQYRHRSRV